MSKIKTEVEAANAAYAADFGLDLRHRVSPRAAGPGSARKIRSSCRLFRQRIKLEDCAADVGGG